MNIQPRFQPILCFILTTLSFSLYAQTDDREKISVKSALAGGHVYFLSCVDGFGGGNVAASVGDDGILLVDDMYSWMAPKLEASLKSIGDKPIRIILNTHYHGDHIQGNAAFKKTSVIVAHENVTQQLIKNKRDLAEVPMLTFTDRISIHFNGEEIQAIHFPNSHSDGDVIVYFTQSKVLHMGDMFFFGMFPAVYTQGGGDIQQLVVSLEKILKDIPMDAKVIPGHGELASMKDLADYTTMLKTSIQIVQTAMHEGKSLEQMKTSKILAAYDALGEGGAQTTDQYLAMLYNLLMPTRK